MEALVLHNFTWWNPTIVFFGEGTIPKLAEQLSAIRARSVLLLYGGGAIFKNGAYAQVTEALTRAGVEFPEVGGVLPNPRVDKVREAIARIKAMPVDAIVPIGGGSVFDSAKAVAAGACYDGDVWDFAVLSAILINVLSYDFMQYKALIIIPYRSIISKRKLILMVIYGKI